MLEPIKKVSVSEAVVSRIRDSITRGELKAGDQLPPERDLATQLGVSRMAVREGIKLLSALGLVEVRQGDGTFVRRPTAGSILDPLVASHLLEAEQLMELIEVRTVLEVEMAGLAARRATAEDREAMTASLSRLEELLAAGLDYLQADLDFHAAICDAARNGVLTRVYANINDLVHHLRMRTHTVPGSGERAVISHRTIFTAIAAGDEKAARRAMRAHMENVKYDLQKLIGAT